MHKVSKLGPKQAGSSKAGLGPSLVALAGEKGHAHVNKPVEVALTQEDLESVAVLFGAIKAVRSVPSASGVKVDVAQLANNFDKHVNLVINRLNQRLAAMDDKARRQTEILMAKHGLFDVCFEEVINYATTFNPQLSAILRKLCLVHTALFQSFPPLVQEVQHHAAEEVSKLRRQAQEAEKETASLLEAAEQLEREAQIQQSELAKVKAELSKAVAENEALRVAYYKRPGRSQPSSITGSVVNNKGLCCVPPPPPGSNRSKPNSVNPSPRTPSEASKPRTSTPQHQNQQPEEVDVSPPAPPASGSDDGGGRSLTLKQLKEMIELIYQSKERHDTKCQEGGLPRETMEQHMYTFLNTRFGLKELIVDNATAILKAVEKYATQDNDVAVFSKILHNEIDEEFALVQQQLKEAVVELVRVQIKGKNPLKTDEFVNNAVADRLNGLLQEEEWVDIIQYMYNHEDSLALMVMIKDICRQKRAEEARRREGMNSRGRPRVGSREPPPDTKASTAILFSDFMKTLLDFQLLGHDRFLSKFREIFQKMDEDQNGVLTEPEFRQLVKSMDALKTENDIQALLEVVDPYNNQQITFSQTVTLLSDEIVHMLATRAGLSAPPLGGLNEKGMDALDRICVGGPAKARRA